MDPAEPLKYQRDRLLVDVPAYAVGLQLQLPDGAPVYLALSATELAFYFQQNLALHYDLEARLVKISEPNQYWRRGQSNRVVHSRKRTAAEGGGLQRTVLAPNDTDAVVAQAHGAVAAVAEALRSRTATIEAGKPTLEAALAGLQPLLERAAQFDAAAARADGARFRSVYRSVAVLPPNEYNSIVVQATEGCSHNQCTFCELYRGVSFRTKTTEEFEAHLQQVIAYQGAVLASRRSLFLGEANALTLPPAALGERLRLMAKYFELPESNEGHVPASWWLGSRRRFDGVASFLDVFTGQRRSVDDWINLRREGLRRVYLGIETGCDELLRWLAKPALAHSIIRTVTGLKEAKLAVAVILLLGAGGKRFAEAHVRETVDVLNQLSLGRNDYIYLSPLVIYKGGPYAARSMTDQITPLSSAEIDEQERQIRAGLTFPNAAGKPHIARYELETFVY